MQSELTRYEMTCPYNGEICCDGIRTDFKPNDKGIKKQCRLWTALQGKDPQSEKSIDFFDCAHAWVPVTNLEMSQRTIQNTTTMQEFRNEVHDKFGRFNMVFSRAVLMMKKLWRQQQEIIEGVPLPDQLENNNGHEN